MFIMISCVFLDNFLHFLQIVNDFFDTFAAPIKYYRHQCNMKRMGFQHGFSFDVLSCGSTPFYYYDLDLLQLTLQEIDHQIQGFPFTVHYAVKANGNKRILKEIANHGFGVDLVSGNEIKAALDAGFEASMMNFSGVGKTDGEIKTGLEAGIACFNVESMPEMQVINQIASSMGKTADMAIRVNPDIDAHTHKFITTGTAENKFGISLEDLPMMVDYASRLPHVNLHGLHFHIGSQITRMEPYIMLCHTVNDLITRFEQQGISFESINVGGGLGIDYDNPDEHPIADFQQYFNIFKRNLNLRPGQQLHFELGRAIVGQCGSLISRVTYVKENRNKKFVILDAGMTDLIRPALYQARHKIQNLTSTGNETIETYDIVGPVCESTDVFAHNYHLPVTHRGDLVAFRSAGAYGESMASCYNMRQLPQSVFYSQN